MTTAIVGAVALLLGMLGAWWFGRRSAPQAVDQSGVAKAAAGKEKALAAANETMAKAEVAVKAVDDKAAKEASDATSDGLAGYLNKR